MSLTPLATRAQLQATPFSDVVRDMASGEIDQLMLRATRRIESACERRLAPFTGLTESYTLQAITLDDQPPFMQPVDQTAALGISRAMSLGQGQLVRNLWLRQYPPLYPDLWTGALSAINLYPSFSGVWSVTVSTVQYEVDRGHVRFALGTFTPPGTTASVTYSGGYSTVPDDLVQACILQAAKTAIVELQPNARPDFDSRELDDEIGALTFPYIRTT